jgi:hypothetical protein
MMPLKISTNFYCEQLLPSFIFHPYSKQVLQFFSGLSEAGKSGMSSWLSSATQLIGAM